MKWLYQIAAAFKKTTSWLISAVVITFLVSYAANISVVMWKDLPDTSLVHIFVWLFQPGLNRIIIFALLVSWVVLLFIAQIVVRYHDSRSSKEQQDASALFTDSHERNYLIKKLKTNSEIQEQPLQEEILSELGLQMKPAILNLPCNLSKKEAEKPIKLLPNGTTILDVYEEHKDILILGKGGSGKSTLLQELDNELFAKAVADSSSSIPVLFNLSSWAVKQGSLADWLKEQLSDKYGLREHDAALYVNEGVILPLLDGLNEVGKDKIHLCIQEISTFRRNQRILKSPPLIICSRKVEDLVRQDVFDSKPVEVEILPLDEQQVKQYISGFGGKLDSLQNALRQDTTLRDIARTPLILHILTLASLRTSLRNLNQGSHKDVKTIFAFYTEQMLNYENKGKHLSYTQKQTYHWLKWLAQYIIQQGQKPFSLERMQSPWSPKDVRYWLYKVTVNGLLAFLILEAFLSIGGFSLTSFIDGFIVGGILGFIITYRARKQEMKPGWSWKVFWWSLIVSLPLAFIFDLITNWGGTLASYFLLLITLEAILAVSMSLVCALGDEITPVDLRWSIANLKRNWRPNVTKVGNTSAFITFVIMIMIFIFGSIFEPSLVFKSFLGEANNQPSIIFILKIIALPFLLLLTSLFMAGFMWLLSASITVPFSGFSNLVLEESKRNRSNQFIWSSVRSSLQAFLLILISVTVVWGVILANDKGTSNVIANLLDGLFTALPIGLAVAIIVAIFYGGAASIKHGLLHLILFFSQDIPWNYSRFLGFAANHFLLKKGDEGYEFLHPLLLEYFLSKNTPLPSPPSEISEPAT